MQSLGRVIGAKPVQEIFHVLGCDFGDGNVTNASLKSTEVVNVGFEPSLAEALNDFVFTEPSIAWEIVKPSFLRFIGSPPFV
ncbi:MAG: hypothetical protein WA996_17505 [Candidatus Promineifilaceae bacterium]